MPKPRTASLRVAHQGICPNSTKTSLDSLDGCACRPAYYTLYRRSDGTPVKSPRVQNRQVADRALRKLLVQLDEDRAEVGQRRPRERKTFGAWADEYLANLETDSRRKGSTIRAYK